MVHCTTLAKLQYMHASFTATFGLYKHELNGSDNQHGLLHLVPG